jgi:tetratricopeptide (TPR) repeat protein
MPMEAAGLLLQAGQAALARSANAEARGHFKRGTEILEKYERTAAPGQPAVDPALDITLRTMHGMAWVVSRGYAVPEAEAEFSGAMTRVRALGDRDVPGTIPALFANWVFMFVRGRTADAAAQGARLRRSADRSGDAGAMMMASLAEGTVLLDQGKFAESIERFDDRFMYGQDPRMYGMVFKAWALWCVGSPDVALTLVHDAVHHTRALHHPHSLGFALAIQGLIEEYRGDVDALTKTAAELTELSAEQGWLQWLAFAQLFTGVIHFAHGREADGVTEMRAGRELSRAMGEKAGAAHYDSILAAAELRAGRLDDAAATLALARAIVESGQHAFEADVVRLEGELARARGDVDAAERAFRRASEVAAAQGARSYELRAQASLESLLRANSSD